jgi:hypothetical protein
MRKALGCCWWLRWLLLLWRRRDRRGGDPGGGASRNDSRWCLLHPVSYSKKPLLLVLVAVVANRGVRRLVLLLVLVVVLITATVTSVTRARLLLKLLTANLLCFINQVMDWLMLPQQALLVRSFAARSVSSHFAHSSRRGCLQTGPFNSS